MKRIEARIKTQFGEIVVEGDSPQEILEVCLRVIPEGFYGESLGRLFRSKACSFEGRS
jgi:hypothetical protein